MTLIADRRKRVFLAIGLFFIFMIGAMTTLTNDLESTGVLLLFSSFALLLYLPFFWLITRKRMPVTLQSWYNKEVLAFAVLLAFISLIGLFETSIYLPDATEKKGVYVIFIVFYAELLFFAGVFIYVNFLSINAKKVGNEGFRTFTFPKKVYWFLAVANLITLLIFNDYWGENELFLIFLFFYFDVLLFLFVRWAFKKIREILNLKNEKAKTELIHLQSQVNPHFFFNMLNSLYGWTAKDPKRAQELILQISDMMRYSIYEGQKELVTLAEEVVYLKNYIALHKSRYLKEIQVDFTEEIQDGSQQITPLLFIILLENAFKHGVENLREAAYVHINLSANKDKIHFRIENNYEKEESSDTTGIGLKNLKRRLELVYPKKHTLSSEVKEDVYSAQLTISIS